MYSIIVPVYKVEKYLPQCIESILAQTYKDFELILIDDGSPDNCPLICDEYAKKDSRVKVLHKKNGGSVSARKAGVNIANGEYICFVDGDDFIECSMLENYEKVICDKKVDMICTGYSEYYSDNNIVSIPQKIKEGLYDRKKLELEIYPQMLSTAQFYSFYVNPTVWSKCFRKELCKEANMEIPDNISLGDDVAIVYYALLKASSVSVINYCGYMYRQNLTSMTHTYDDKLYEKIKNLIIYLKDVEKRTGWNFGDQINEYALYLLILAKNNEFKFNVDESYRNKARNIKNKFLVWCFKTKFLAPINVYETLIQKGKNNE